MEIALIADDQKKALISEFCIAYCGVLSRHNLYATATTGRQITQATGLKVNELLSGVHGGVQQLASRIMFNEIDVLLYFRDVQEQQYNDDSNSDLLKLCDLNNIPAATNIATAEALILALDRGDLDWRILVNPKNKK